MKGYYEINSIGITTADSEFIPIDPLPTLLVL